MNRAWKWGWVGFLLMAGLVVQAGLAGAQVVHSEMVCTVEIVVDPLAGTVDPVTQCIHADTGQAVPGSSGGALDVQIASGGCFYMGSRPTRWVNLGFTAQGELEYGWSPDGRPGGHTLIGTASPCSWRKVETEEIEGFVWSRIGSYTHQSPQVSFDPPVPRGVVGIETFAALGVPSPWIYASTSPYTGRSLRAEVRVRQVSIAWDDGPPQSFGGSQLFGFTGYPHGVASHTYQTKSCDRTAPRCRSKTGDYRIRTAFVWSGWYRVGSRKGNLRIPTTSSSVDYPVAEIIALVGG